ncbi:putative aminotransferase [Gordonia araii NBRC 100433]|uniref:Putative aminotransferase n=1 Tax=Gordonia araii NBRC 100433 TaxID=1073574 RepID=G7H6I0_9ACTN|nr:aminotransferase class V-fold PLP-dependent enzyme [Gordonia araii]NNG96135.1 aminotransferase class V-fold PLP-dependent enzyme [Gordonia araii NBRC 100433]GAB11455.1 putative aminotransferase [Gordonia araii NBRC 100433]
MFLSELGSAWHDARIEPEITHLDSASAGRSSNAVIEAITGHLWEESRHGSYVAMDAAEQMLERGSRELAALIGHHSDELVYRDTARAALRAMLGVANLPVASTVWVAKNEFGPNLVEFERRGFSVHTLPAASVYGHVDTDALENMLQFEQPDFIHVCHIGSASGIVQPVAEIVEIAHAADVPVVVDMAQAVGHVPTITGADIVYGTSRKWLTGPRGVGFVAIRADSRLRVEITDMEAGTTAGFIAGRLGLGAAVGELIGLGPQAVFDELAAIGRATRERLTGIGSWEVVEPVDEPSALVTLAPPPGFEAADVIAAANHLRDAGLLVTPALPERTPLMLDNAVLRLSPHLDAKREDLDRLASELRTMGYRS